MRFAKPGQLILFILLSVPAWALPSASSLDIAFRQLDHNHDNNIGLVEWDQYSFALFHAADRNKDGQLSTEEVKENADAIDTFDRFDSNRDGRLSIDEFMQLRRMLFTVADINANDYLDSTEYVLFRLISEAGWVDTNNNGRLNFSELRASLAAVFKVADVNGDQKLSADEAHFLNSAVYNALTSDGPLTYDKLNNYYRHLLTGD